LKKLKWWVAYLLAGGAAMYLAIKPYRIIHPKLPQTPEGLEFVYQLKQWTVFVIPILLVICLAILVLLWQKSRWWTKLLSVICLAPAGFAVWLVNTNPFEMMFNPLPKPEFVKIEEVDFVNDEDMVIAVNIGQESVAYPIRQMAYHHIVQDIVGGVPIAVTY